MENGNMRIVPFDQMYFLPKVYTKEYCVIKLKVSIFHCLFVGRGGFVAALDFALSFFLNNKSFPKFLVDLIERWLVILKCLVQMIFYLKT